MKRIKYIAAALLIPMLGLVGCTCTVGVKQKTGAYGECTGKFVIDPPATELASLDTSQALAVLTTQNLQVTNTTGSFIISVSDTTTGQMLGQTTFPYKIVGMGIYATDPQAVHNWLSTFSVYGSEDVTTTLTASDIAIKPTIVSGTAVLGLAAVYSGVTYGSGTYVTSVTSGGFRSPYLHAPN